MKVDTPFLGPVLGFPVLYANVSVSSLTLGPGTSLAMLAAATSEGVVSALRRAEVRLLEPCMQLHVSVPEEYMGKVLSDLTSQRRAHIQDVGGSHGTDKVITAITPLAGLMVGVAGPPWGTIRWLIIPIREVASSQWSINILGDLLKQAWNLRI